MVFRCISCVIWEERYLAMEKRKVYRQAGIGGFRRFLAAAAVLALMAASFTVGALAFSREVPVEQETIELPGIGLTLILPDSWKGRYEVEKDEGESWCRVYARSVLEKNPEWGGALFYVDRSYDRPMTPEELDELRQRCPVEPGRPGAGAGISSNAGRNQPDTLSGGWHSVGLTENTRILVQRIRVL